jgi:hypothetical protein
MPFFRPAVLALAPLALAGCGWLGGGDGAQNKTAAADKVEVAPKAGPGEEIVTVDTGASAASTAGATPMAERVAVLGLLNKRNGQARDLTLKPGQAVRAGEVIVRLRACEKTAPWESDQLTGAFAQVDVHEADGKWKRAFSGWLYKERPALNVVQHPVYDVWVKSCTMTFPETGGEEVSAGASGSRAGGSGGAAKSSSAPKSADTPATPEASPAAPSPSASDSIER